MEETRYQGKPRRQWLNENIGRGTSTFS